MKKPMKMKPMPTKDGGKFYPTGSSGGIAKAVEKRIAAKNDRGK